LQLLWEFFHGHGLRRFSGINGRWYTPPVATPIYPTLTAVLGVPLLKPVAGLSCGLIVAGGADGPDFNQHALLLDLKGFEDVYGAMDVKVAGTRDGITSVQVLEHGIAGLLALMVVGCSLTLVWRGCLLSLCSRLLTRYAIKAVQPNDMPFVVVYHRLSGI
jgi:hypothetical protein